MKNVTVYVLTKTLINGFKFADISKEEKILRENTDNKFNFNSRTKTSVEKLVRYTVTFLEWVNTLITIIKESRLESKGSLNRFHAQTLLFCYIFYPEAVVQRCSVKKVFLEVSQNSQENTCARVSFLIKLQA